MDIHIYDVFLSFRGADTRNNFTDHLYKALINANIATFLDEEEIETGEDLKPELENAIRSSRASVIVLSKNYASSTWCLDELALVLERRRVSDHVVIPIFYHVEPTHLKKIRIGQNTDQEQNTDQKQNSFKVAMAGHRRKMEAETDPEKKRQWGQKIDRWEKALEEVANLKGNDIKDWPETDFIDKIIQGICTRLGILVRSNLPNLIGVEHHIRFIGSWLKDGSTHTADILTIYGMGGIGKTSLAKSVYSKNRHLFQRSRFIENINKKCDLLSLQNQLCANISQTSSVQVSNKSEYTFKTGNALNSKKVLIVLDDVDKDKQLIDLLGTKGFPAGSKIIITTRDASLTKQLKLHNSNVQPKHTMCLLQGLSFESSLELFSLHAFTCNGDKEGYEAMSKKLVNYCDGHPLALEVMGKALHKTCLATWGEYIDGLNKETDSRIREVLKVSFDSLQFKRDKKLFKHIACFFAGKDRVFAEAVFKKSLNEIKHLIDRCLLTIGPRNELKMHQLLQDMGKDFVRQEHHRPWKRSRLWRHREFFDVLEMKKDKGKLKGIIFDGSELGEETLEVETDALRTMDNLCLLQLNYVKFEGSYKNFPKKLKWLCMHGFPSQSLPSDLPMSKLAVLDMTYSKIESFDLSKGNVESFPQLTGKNRELIGSRSKDDWSLASLKILNLSFCYQLRRLQCFSKLPALERLILAGCRSLVEICKSIDKCTKLVVIDLSYCIMLKKLPVKEMSTLKHLEALSLDGCNLDEPPEDLQKNINANRSLQASSSVTKEPQLNDVKSSAICLATSLGYKNPSECNIWCEELYPMACSSLDIKTELILDGSPIVFLPNGVKSLRRIELLSSEEHDMLKKIKNPPCTRRNLKFSRWDLLKEILALSPITRAHRIYSMAQSLTRIEGVVQIRPIEDVKADVLYGFDWKDLDFIKNEKVETWHDLRRKERSPVQLVFEFGIFSTFYGGKEMPKWIMPRIKGLSISFTVPSSSMNLRGLNFCHLQTGRDPDNGVSLPTVIVRNITKNCTWIYKHYIHWVKVDEECLIWLSHWMLGKNDMENGDVVTISIPPEDISANVSIRECGVSFVYDDGRVQEDVLGDYKKWDHIIGRDLSPFCLTTKEYFLDNHRFFWWHIDCPVYRPFIANGACYEEEGVYFRAIPQQKIDMVNGSPEDIASGMKELQLAI